MVHLIFGLRHWKGISNLTFMQLHRLQHWPPLCHILLHNSQLWLLLHTSLLWFTSHFPSADLRITWGVAQTRGHPRPPRPPATVQMDCQAPDHQRPRATAAARFLGDPLPAACDHLQPPMTARNLSHPHGHQWSHSSSQLHGLPQCAPAPLWAIAGPPPHTDSRWSSLHQQRALVSTVTQHFPESPGG